MRVEERDPRRDAAYAARVTGQLNAALLALVLVAVGRPQLALNLPGG